MKKIVDFISQSNNMKCLQPRSMIYLYTCWIQMSELWSKFLMEGLRRLNLPFFFLLFLLHVWKHLSHLIYTLMGKQVHEQHIPQFRVIQGPVRINVIEFWHKVLPPMKTWVKELNVFHTCNVLQCMAWNKSTAGKCHQIWELSSSPGALSGLSA